VALGGEVDDRARGVLLEQMLLDRLIADVRGLEQQPGIVPVCRQVLQVPCISELVDDEHGLFAAGQPMGDEIGADEAGSPGYDDHLSRFSCSSDSCVAPATTSSRREAGEVYRARRFN
jgi:hypothetical protein